MLFYEFTPTTLMGVSVSNNVSKEIGVHRTPFSSMLIVKCYQKWMLLVRMLVKDKKWSILGGVS